MKFLSVFVFFCANISALVAESTSTKFSVDAQKSTVAWVGKKVLVNSSHNGTVGLKSGDLQVVDGQVKSGSFVVDMQALKVLDITDPKDNAKLKGHLQSDDFFGVAKFPESKFEIKSVTSEKNKSPVTVKGDLTIKGITAPIQFPATIVVNGDQLTFAGKVNVDRTKYNVKFASKQFFENLAGDRIIADEFQIDVNLVAAKK